MASVVNDPTVLLHDHTTASEALQALHEAGVPGAPVIDAHGTYLGTVDIDVLAPLAEADSTLPVVGVLDTTTTTVAIDTTLDVGLEALTQAGGHWVTVTSKSRHVVGILAIGDLVRGYRQALDTNVGKISHVATHAVAVEERVGPHSKLIGHPIRTAGLPAGCVVVTVQHGNGLLFATGTTTLAEGDVVSVLTSPQSVDTLRHILRGTPEPEQEQADTHHDGLGAPTPGTATPRHAP
ncbi:MAG: TrkA C-terminal domain-containing protein [Acidimicrobiales bacterium]